MAEVIRYETPDLQDHDPNYRSGNAVVVLATDYDAALARIARLEAALHGLLHWTVEVQTIGSSYTVARNGAVAAAREPSHDPPSPGALRRL